MENKSFLRGMATVNFWADDVCTARDWYAKLFGVSAYFQSPNAEQPAYVEFRIGDYQAEFGIVDRKYAPQGIQAGPGGVTLYWHVNDIESAFETLKSMSAQVHAPITRRGNFGFITASVIDPFGNILGIMQNPHYVEILHSHTK